VPYGTKSVATVERYSIELSGLLLSEGAKMIVIACNTASAVAVPALRKRFKVPVVGVIEPGARAACARSKTGRIGVIGTRNTILSRAYERAIHDIEPRHEVFGRPCPLFVPLIEEGWLNDPVSDAVIERYLSPLLDLGIDTLVLGCTHYPLLSQSIQRFVGKSIALVDSGKNTAQDVKRILVRSKMTAPKGSVGRLNVALTDQSGAFLRVAEKELGLNVGDPLIRTVQAVYEGS
jgi:glutamate racemase